MNIFEKLSVVVGGTLFGFGLAFSGASQPEVVISFLRLEDLGLLFVIGIALFITALAYNLLPKILKTPLFSEKFMSRISESVSSRTIVGAVIFGVGWGISGLCPGTSLAALGTGNVFILYGILGMFLGTFVYGHTRGKR